MNHQDTKAKDFQIKFGNLPTKLAFNYNYGMTNNSIQSIFIERESVYKLIKEVQGRNK